MLINYNLKNLIGSPLNKKLIKNTNHGFSFISMFGDFYITSDRFLPICSQYFCTSNELFGFYEKPKYEHLFSKSFKDKILKNEKIEVINNAFILGSTGNYYHDIIDCYSRIFSFKKSFKFHKNLNCIVICEIKIKNILEELLNYLNIDLPIIELKRDTIYKFENSIIQSNRNFKRTINLYRKFFLDNKIVPYKKIFISKNDSLNRKILNEIEIINFLKKKGFEIFTLSGMCLKEQIQLFSSSNIIISMHGAALTNLMFCKEKTTVIEVTGNFLKDKSDWFSKKNSTEFNSYTRSMYNKLSKEAGLNHFYYFSEMENLHERINLDYDFEKFTKTNLIVDLEKFKTIINSHLR